MVINFKPQEVFIVSSFSNADVLLCNTSPQNLTSRNILNCRVSLKGCGSQNEPLLTFLATRSQHLAVLAIIIKLSQKPFDRNLGVWPERVFMKSMRFYFKGAFLGERTYSDCFWFTKTRSWHFLQEVQHFLISSNSHLWEMLQFIPAFEVVECH